MPGLRVSGDAQRSSRPPRPPSSGHGHCGGAIRTCPAPLARRCRAGSPVVGHRAALQLSPVGVRFLAKRPHRSGGRVHHPRRDACASGTEGQPDGIVGRLQQQRARPAEVAAHGRWSRSSPMSRAEPAAGDRRADQGDRTRSEPSVMLGSTTPCVSVGKSPYWLIHGIPGKATGALSGEALRRRLSGIATSRKVGTAAGILDHLARRCLRRESESGRGEQDVAVS
jgi:hypothetical protein